MQKKYDFLSEELFVQKLWQNNCTYTWDMEKKMSFSIDTPPPTVSGLLHIGHVFSYTQTDIIARYERMNGNSVFYPFGFDDNGLPTERFVEKKRMISAHHMARTQFIHECLEETKSIEKQFQELWQKLGLSVDWKLCYSTIEPLVRHISQLSFIRLYQQGYVYRKSEPALFCTSCRTSVAQAELDDKESETIFFDIRFDSTSAQMITIATTRPELLSSCVAIFYHPEDQRYTALAGKTATVPIFGYTVPFIADQKVIPEKGTGLVMCATFGDTTDISWYHDHQLAYKPSMNQHGVWLDQTGVLAGLKVMQAREKIVALLKQDGYIIHEKKIRHVVSIHERCQNPIEYMIIPQWFLKLLPFKKEFLELADQIAWYPAFMKTRYVHWVENLKWDWCLSRQRFYGIPFPVWHCSQCHHVLIAQEKQLPVDPQEVVFDGECPECHHKTLIPDTDVMDTWNSSSLTPYICSVLQGSNVNTLFDKPYQPMDMRPQAHDIIRTWAFYTMVKTWLHHKTIPWKKIVISGHVLSSEQEKISKSKSNSPLQPENLLKKYPADVIRYWTASGKLGADVMFSEEQLKQGNRLLIKLWNAFLFIKEHAPSSAWNYLPQQHMNFSPMHAWIIRRINESDRLYKKYFEQNEISSALDVIERFFWSDFCDNYLEIIKNILFHPQQYTQEEVMTTASLLLHIGYFLLQKYAPFIPHITEVIYQKIYRSLLISESLHNIVVTDFFHNLSQSIDEQNVIMGDLIILILAQVRKLKTDQHISLRSELAILTVCAPAAMHSSMHIHEQIIKGVTHAQRILFEVAPKQRLLQIGDVLHAWVTVP